MVLGAGNPRVNQKDPPPHSSGAYILVKGSDDEQSKKTIAI